MVQAQGVMAQQNWRSAMRLSDFMTADVVVKAGQGFQKLGEYVVPAGQVIGLGFGTLNGQQDAEGRIFFDLKDNSAAPGVSIDGTVQFAIYDPNDHPLVIQDEYDTSQLRTVSNDRTKQLPFPFQNAFASRDRKLVVFFKPVADGTVSKTNSTLIMDVTKSYGQ